MLGIQPSIQHSFSTQHSALSIMLMILVVVSVLGGYALYSMKPEERSQLKERLVIAATRARSEAERRRAEPEPFRDALRERTPWPVVMPALVALNVVLFVLSASAGSAPEALVSWGASFGPRTSNGEWWRLRVLDVSARRALPADRQLRRARAAWTDPRTAGRPCHVRSRLLRGRRLREHRVAVGLSDAGQQRRLGRHLRALRPASRLVSVVDAPPQHRPSNR